MWGGIHTICSDPKTKIYGAVTTGEVPVTRWSSGRIRGTKGDTYKEESDVGADLRRDIEVLVLCYLLRMCVFNINVETPTQNPVSEQAAHKGKLSRGFLSEMMPLPVTCVLCEQGDE